MASAKKTDRDLQKARAHHMSIKGFAHKPSDEINRVVAEYHIAGRDLVDELVHPDLYNIPGWCFIPVTPEQREAMIEGGMAPDEVPAVMPNMKGWRHWSSDTLDKMTHDNSRVLDDEGYYRIDYGKLANAPAIFAAIVQQCWTAAESMSYSLYGMRGGLREGEYYTAETRDEMAKAVVADRELLHSVGQIAALVDQYVERQKALKAFLTARSEKSQDKAQERLEVAEAKIESLQRWISLEVRKDAADFIVEMAGTAEAATAEAATAEAATAEAATAEAATAEAATAEADAAEADAAEADAAGADAAGADAAAE